LVHGYRSQKSSNRLNLAWSHGLFVQKKSPTFYFFQIPPRSNGMACLLACLSIPHLQKRYFPSFRQGVRHLCPIYALIYA
ncbi:MAG: hypothetical protein WCI11_20300, partial [Candidatus Methylumidiphilus sp.]